MIRIQIGFEHLKERTVGNIVPVEIGTFGSIPVPVSRLTKIHSKKTVNNTNEGAECILVRGFDKNRVWFVHGPNCILSSANDSRDNSKKNVASRILTFVPKLMLHGD